MLKPLRNGECRKNVVLAAGRVDNWRVKGFDVLIRAFGKLVQGLKSKVQDEGWKLVIAGVWRKPETRTYLDGIAEECGVLDKIEYNSINIEQWIFLTFVGITAKKLCGTSKDLMLIIYYFNHISLL